MRIDKLLSHMGFGSRREVKELLKKSVVEVNGQRTKDGKFNVNEEADKVVVSGEPVVYQEFFYYMLNKPQGVISATEDRSQSTVLDLFSKGDYRSDLFPVGRLDKDTVGLLLITNDGELAHELLSPKKHVDKTYQAKIQGTVNSQDQVAFAEGLILKNGEVCQGAQLTILDTISEKEQSIIRLVIQEGKFHQVKRMFEAVDKKVIALKRETMGSLMLDETLTQGAYRKLTDSEIIELKKHKTK